MRYMINTRTGVISRATPLLMKMKRMIVAPNECAEMHEQFGIESFVIHAMGTEQMSFEPVIPKRWLHPEHLTPEDGEAVTDMLAALNAYIEGKQNVQTVEQSLVVNGQIPNTAPVTQVSRGKPAVTSPGAISGSLSVPDDFDLGVNIAQFSKAQLLSLGARIKGLAVHSGMTVKQIRPEVQDALDQLRKAAHAERKAEAMAEQRRAEEQRQAEAARAAAEQEQQREAEQEPSTSPAEEPDSSAGVGRDDEPAV